MKKRLLVLAGIILPLVVAMGQPDKITGLWLPAKGTSQVKIFKATDGKYYGRVDWIIPEKREELDVNNPDPKLREKKVLGMTILKGFTYNTDKKVWEGGTVYDPDNGKTYDCYMWFDGPDNVMTLKGYVLGMRFLGRSENWKREAAPRK
jgi:uncharacterized protein (DUF2147 family)